VGLSMKQRQAVAGEMVQRYQRASKKGKGAILDELCALTGWNRDHARRALRRVEPARSFAGPWCARRSTVPR
jgi:hypothetical protein